MITTKLDASFFILVPSPFLGIRRNKADLKFSVNAPLATTHEE